MQRIDRRFRSIDINQSIDRSILVSRAKDGNEGECGRMRGMNE